MKEQAEKRGVKVYVGHGVKGMKDLGAKGVFYRVRLVGFDTQDDAGRACSKLKSKGVKCYISKAAS